MRGTVKPASPATKEKDLTQLDNRSNGKTYFVGEVPLVPLVQ